MATFSWDITEGIPTALPSSAGGEAGLYRVHVEEFDVAFGDLPFMLNLGVEEPYERTTAQWQKSQFDAQQLVGEQSLDGWWLRSQQAFFGGDGIEYYEPLVGEGSEERFRDSSGVEVFTDDGSVNLLKQTELAFDGTASDLEIEAGPNRLLQRDGTSVTVWDGSTETAVTGTSTAVSLAYTGSVFLVGDSDNIYTLAEDTGTTLSALWTNTGGNTNVFWAKNRIFAGVGPDLYEATLAGGDLQVALNPLISHPDSNWEWTAVTETGGAAWAAGFSGEKSEVHVISIDETGATPTLTGGVVAIKLPTTELVNAMEGYLNFLLIGTNRGFRVALTSGTDAGLGPLVWRDEEVLAVHGREDFAYTGHANGLTRKVDLGNEAAGDLGFAWANHLTAGSGSVQSFAWFGNTEHFAVSGEGTYREHATDLVSSGYLETGFIRFGTTELKHYEGIQLTADATNGTIVVLHQRNNASTPTSVATVGQFNGARTLSLNQDAPSFRMLLRFTLNRDVSDNTLGPTLHDYTLRALPAPQRRQRLFRIPLMLTDNETNRQGVSVGNYGFAYARLQELESREKVGGPVVFQDFRTGEARRAIIEQVTLVNPESPDRGRHNFGGSLFVTIRTID